MIGAKRRWSVTWWSWWPPVCGARGCPSPESVQPGTIDVFGEGADSGRAMFRLILLLFGAVRSACRSRAGLMFENLALRQQLAAFARSGRRPRVSHVDRCFWIALRRLWPRWSEALVFVKPETVIRWHRAGFPRWTGQKRPVVDGSNPASHFRTGSCTSSGIRVASRLVVSCASYAGRL